MVLLKFFSFTGACPLIALVNVLSLRGISILPDTETVSDEWLLGALDRFLSRRMKRLQKKIEDGEWSIIQERETVELVKTKLGNGNYSLTSPLNMDPDVHRVDMFASEVCFNQFNNVGSPNIRSVWSTSIPRMAV
jgi:hypothetical protein